MQLKKIQTRIFCGQKPKVFIKIKYPEQVAEPESCVTVRIFLFGAVSSKKRYLPTAPFLYDELHHEYSFLRAALRNGPTDVTSTVNSAQAPLRHTRASA